MPISVVTEHKYAVAESLARNGYGDLVLVRRDAKAARVVLRDSFHCVGQSS